MEQLKDDGNEMVAVLNVVLNDDENLNIDKNLKIDKNLNDAKKYDDEKYDNIDTQMDTQV